jgi:hypothetical protein
MRRLTVLFTGLLVLGASEAVQAQIVISPTVPTDIQGGAPNANLTQAGLFAWIDNNCPEVGP